MTANPEYGGTGLWGYSAHVVAMEETAAARRRPSASHGVHSNLCVNQINRWGTLEQKEKWPPLCVSEKGALAMSESGSGSDVVSMK